MLPLALMHLRYIYYALWIAPVPVFLCLALLMVRRKLNGTLPLFFSFVIFEIAQFGVAFYTYHESWRLYFYLYWVLATMETAFAFGVLYEVFVGVFEPFADLRELGRIIFRWAALVLTLAATLLVTTAKPMPNATRLYAALVNLMRSVEVMQCGLVLLMLLCSAYLGITLKHRIFGIALGFGVIAAVDLIAVTVLANLGQQAATFVKLSKMGVYNLSALLWLGYLYAGELERKPTRQFAHAERWDYALAAALHPSEGTPSLPLIENAVERIFKQTNGHGPDAPPPNADQ